MEETLGKRIAGHRKRLGLTQDALAERLGITAQAVSKWENDQSCPDITMLPRLAEVFDCTTDELLGLPKKEVYMAEIIPEQETEEPGKPAGLRMEGEDGMWELKWDAGRRSSLGFAVWILLSGFLLFISVDAQLNASLWDILWTSGLLLFGLFGIVYPHFSILRLGCAFLGGCFLCQRVFSVSMEMDYILVAFLLCFGAVLLIGALRKPKKGSFHVRHNGRNMTKNHCVYDGETFDCATSFGENHHLITLPRLSGGSASLSFGELKVDLSGCGEIADGCTLELSSSFGELELLVPKRYRVEANIRTAFASFETKGAPDADADAVIYVNGNAGFGEIVLRYL